ncbi:hypothetical protein ABZ897_16220 [Nonomuraea sp. NPDC046802]|uniref:hypothetical protein n=1 Tax=Nonomuraea sp. NPDC046802 TaxID=3154919 RepID=UPI0033FA13B4
MRPPEEDVKDVTFVRCLKSGKIRYTTRRAARRVVRRAHRGEKKHTYVCDSCQGFHIGGAIDGSGCRRPWLRCQTDTAPVFDLQDNAQAYADRAGGVVAPCSEHWHVCPLPIVA